MENKTKTGAVICRKAIPGTLVREYEALLFIKNIPHEMNDERLAEMLQGTLAQMELHECVNILVRSDINATSNEVWEQYNQLNGDTGRGKIIDFTSLRPMANS